jgi:2-deoxy-D-gluconate 3-dehydrogenase
VGANPFDLAGRTAVVTGGASGLGKGMAAALAGAGAKLVLADRDAAMLERARAELSGIGPPVHAMAGDVTDAAFRERCLAESLARFGRVHVLVCAAGRALRKDALSSTAEDYDAVMDVNLKALFLWNQEFGRHMIAAGGGSIVNVASQGAFTPLAGRPLYGASKAAVAHLTRSLARDWIAQGVRVNAIAPGLMDTPFIAAMKAEPGRVERDVARIPAGRLGMPDDLAGPVLLLASDAGRYIVGQTLIVDGGWTLF